MGEQKANQIDNLRLLNFSNNQLSELIEILKDSNASVIISEFNGDIAFVNSVFESRTGYSSSEVIGKNPRFLKSDETDSEKHKKLWETITSGKEWRGEFKNKRKNGELFWEYSTIYPITDVNNKISYFLAIKEDISQLKLLENSLLETNQRKKSKELKFEFLNQISQEIVLPILSAREFVQFLKIKCSPNECDKCANSITYLDLINQHLNKVLETAELLKDMSEIKTDSADAKLKLYDITFLGNLVKEIKDPAYMVLGILSLLKDGCLSKHEAKFEMGYSVIYNTCQRIIFIVDTFDKCSINEKNDLNFYKNVLSRVFKEKEILKQTSVELVSAPAEIINTINDRLTETNTELNSEQNLPIKPKHDLNFKIESSLFVFKRNLDLLLESMNFKDLTVAFYNANSASFKTAKNFRGFCGNLMDLGTKKLIVDLSICNNIDQTFVGVLVVVKRALIGLNGDMVLVLNPKQILLESFALLNLELQFDVYPNVEKAIKNFDNVKPQYNWEHTKKD